MSAEQFRDLSSEYYRGVTQPDFRNDRTYNLGQDDRRDFNSPSVLFNDAYSNSQPPAQQNGNQFATPPEYPLHSWTPPFRGMIY